MQRLPGVSLTRGDGGEGRNITVRGLAAEFTRVRINGMEGTSQTGASDVYGSGNNGRSFDFNVFPSEIFTSLSVRKTPSANMEEGSLGATVDLQAPHPLDYHSDFALTATARGIYNEVSRQADPRISGLISRSLPTAPSVSLPRHRTDGAHARCRLFRRAGAARLGEWRLLFADRRDAAEPDKQRAAWH